MKESDLIGDKLNLNDHQFNTEKELPVGQFTKNESETADGPEVLVVMESELESIQAGLEKKAEAVIKLAEQNFATNPSKLRKLSLMAKQIALRGFKVTAGAAVLFGAFVTADNKLTRWEVSAEKDPQTSHLQYKHEDSKTTHIIKVLSGKEKFDEHEEQLLIKDILCEDHTFPFLQQQGFWEGSKDDLQNASEQQISDILKKLHEFRQKGSISESAETVDGEALQENFLTIEPGVEDDLVYESLWKLMEECGNPKIRIVSSSEYLVKGSSGTYNPISNTVYVEPTGDIVKILLAELAHGKQFHERPYYYSLIGLRDFIKAGSSPFLLRNMDEAYGDLYTTPGSIEYDAHTVKEEELSQGFYYETKDGPINQKRVKEIMDKRTAEQADERQ